MVVFITNYDEATSCNYNIYQNINLPFSIELLGDDATGGKLIAALIESKRNVFAMSHGDKNILFDQNSKETFTQQNLSALPVEPINVFSYACNTSVELGEVAASNNVRWLGFVIPINAPEEDQELRNIYKDLFTFIGINFPSVACEASALDFLDNLKELCDSKFDELDQLSSDHGYRAPIPAFSSIKQLWEQQRIWLSEGQSVMHPSAPPALLYW